MNIKSFKPDDKIGIKFTNIRWDYSSEDDEEPIDGGAPTECTHYFDAFVLTDIGTPYKEENGFLVISDEDMESTETEEALSEWLTEHYGWLHNGFNYEWDFNSLPLKEDE